MIATIALAAGTGDDSHCRFGRHRHAAHIGNRIQTDGQSRTGDCLHRRLHVCGNVVITGRWRQIAARPDERDGIAQLGEQLRQSLVDFVPVLRPQERGEDGAAQPGPRGHAEPLLQFLHRPQMSVPRRGRNQHRRRSRLRELFQKRHRALFIQAPPRHVPRRRIETGDCRRWVVGDWIGHQTFECCRRTHGQVVPALV